MADRENPVPDALWAQVTEHDDERAISALLLFISVTNMFNRMNVAIGQGAAGSWKHA